MQYSKSRATVKQQPIPLIPNAEFGVACGVVTVSDIIQIGAEKAEMLDTDDLML